MSTNTFEEKQDALIKKMAVDVAAMPDDVFASRIVGMLILDRGRLNAYQRTLELMLKVHAQAITIRNANMLVDALQAVKDHQNNG